MPSRRKGDLLLAMVRRLGEGKCWDRRRPWCLSMRRTCCDVIATIDDRSTTRRETESLKQEELPILILLIEDRATSTVLIAELLLSYTTESDFLFFA
jgi:hypothetical protein